MSNCSCGSRGGLKVQSAALSAEPESGTSRFPRETTQLFDSPRGYLATWQGFALGSKWLQNGPVFPGFFCFLRIGSARYGSLLCRISCRACAGFCAALFATVR